MSDQSGALSQDPTLINAWGLAFNPKGPAWVSATDSGVSEVYDAAGAQVIPPVVMPDCGGGAASPTGQVFNESSDAFVGDSFIFVTEQGAIAGWQPALGSEAKLRAGAAWCAVRASAVPAPKPKANYKGVTIAKDANGSPRLFAANFLAGTVDVFDASYAPINMAGRFHDPELPAGFGPFNVQEVGGQLVVTYAMKDEEGEDEVIGAGNGFVDLYDVDGGLVARLVSGGELDAPWGVAMTPADFGAMPNRLLIGNFGDGLVHVYAPDAGAGISRLEHEGTLTTASGDALAIDGLWALRFGLGAGGFSSDVLYFTAGPDEESHGVFGRLEILGGSSAPAPGPYAPATHQE